MFNQLQWLIGLTLNRAPSGDTIGIYRGSYDVSNGDLGIHGGATNAPGAPTLHLDGFVWDGIHQADSAQTQPRAVSMLLHEAAHTFGADHIPPPGVLLNYNNFNYFKHVIVDDPNSCVKQFYQ